MADKSTTYAGVSLRASLGLPNANTAAGFGGVTFTGGKCALHTMPGIMRDWSKVQENLVCRTTNTKKKGSATWADVTFPLSRLPGDAMQAILVTLENDKDGIGSFEFVLPGGAGTIFLTAQVAKFAIADGGGQDDFHKSSVELLIQEEPVFVPVV